MTKQTKKQRDEQHEAVSESADESASLRERVAELEAAVGAAKEARQRALADFLNYQKRAMVNEREAREEGAGRVVESLLTVADYLDMALKQDPATVPAKAVMDGVWLIREELHKVFLEHGVSPISPKPGDAPDPGRHDAMGHEDAPGVGPGLIARVEAPGYHIAGRVLRPAKVFLTPSEPNKQSNPAANADEPASED